MEAILEFVQKLLEYLKEFEAAGIIELIKESGILDTIAEFFKNIPMPL